MTDQLPLTRDTVELLAGDFDPWLSCDECFDWIDQVVDDLLLRDIGLPPTFQAHLRGCTACREEAEALIELAAADAGIDVPIACLRFEAEINGL